MSKRINVNPGHYKVAGRERQGEEVNAAEERAELTKKAAEYKTEHKAPRKGPKRKS